MRNGTGGQSMVEECVRLGVAAISYRPLERTDLSKHPEGEPKNLWKRLESSQKASLRRLAYEMAEGDRIYLKEGPEIIDRGVVTGKYSFDSDFRIVDGNGSPWAHQVHVDWSRQFPPIKIQLGKSQQLTVEELLPNEARRIEEAAEPEAAAASRLGRLIEDAYYRESPARLKFIIPRHNKLSNDFCKWLEGEHQIRALQPRGGGGGCRIEDLLWCRHYEVDPGSPWTTAGVQPLPGTEGCQFLAYCPRPGAS
jgi:hypothetical protein